MSNPLRLALAAVVVAVLALACGLMTNAAPQPVVTAVNVRGNTHVPTDRIAAVIRTQVGLPLDPKQVTADQQAILGLGYFTDVKTDIHPTPGGVAVSYIVVENPVVSKINFTGNKQVTSDVLLALMDTTIGSVLNTNTLRDDVQKINSYYDKLGYIGTRHVQDIKIDPSGAVDMAIKEGVTITNIVVSGNTVFPTPLILAQMKTKVGSVFSGEVFNSDLNAVSDLYKNAGLSAVVDGAPEVDHPGVVDLTVCEARVGAIEIAGNSVTRDYVIRRLLRMKPGQLVSDAALRRDYEAIYNTQFFKTVDVSTKPFDNKCGELTLVWTVQEQRNGTAGVNVSYGGGGQFGQGFGYGLSFSQNNLAGTGNSASVTLQKGQYFSNVDFSIGIPYIYKFKADSLSLSVFNDLQNNQPRPVYKVGGNNPFYALTPTASLTTASAVGTASTCVANGNPCTNQIADYTARSAGFTISFGHPVADYTRLNLGLTSTRLYQNVIASGFPQAFLELAGTTTTSGSQLGSTNLRSITPSIFKDNRDDVTSPRHGGTVGFSEEFSTHAFGSDYNFAKGDWDFTHFWPVKHHSAFGLHLNYGFTLGQANALPYNDLFSLSDQQLRGTKYVYYGNREVLAQAELRIPVTSDKKFGIALFADSGDAPYVTPVQGPSPAPTPQPPAGPHAPFFTPAPLPLAYVNAPIQLQTDFGIGIRVQTPLLPQVIRVDFAIGNQGAHTSFGIGQSF